jgi:hypothetical protein
MPITLTKPLTVIVNDIGDTFVVESCKLDFTKKEAQFHWRIKTSDGKVLKQGEVKIADEVLSSGRAFMSYPSQEVYDITNDFTTWYNEEYKSHEDLVKMVAEKAGYAGVFKTEELV